MHGQRLHACAAAMQTGVEPIAISVPQSARACIRQAAGCQQPACIGLCPKTQNPTHRRFKGVMCLTDIDECEAALGAARTRALLRLSPHRHRRVRGCARGCQNEGTAPPVRHIDAKSDTQAVPGRHVPHRHRRVRGCALPERGHCSDSNTVDEDGEPVKCAARTVPVLGRAAMRAGVEPVAISTLTSATPRRSRAQGFMLATSGNHWQM